jgi:hypothetical protein
MRRRATGRRSSTRRSLRDGSTITWSHEQVVKRPQLDCRKDPVAERWRGGITTFRLVTRYRVAGFDSVGVTAFSQGPVAPATRSLVFGGVDSAVERTGWYRGEADRDRNSDVVSRHPGVTWPRLAAVMIPPFLLGHRAGVTDPSGSVASIDAPHPRLHAVALYEG